MLVVIIKKMKDVQCDNCKLNIVDEYPDGHMYIHQRA